MSLDFFNSLVHTITSPLNEECYQCVEKTQFIKCKDVRYIIKYLGKPFQPQESYTALNRERSLEMDRM